MFNTTTQDYVLESTNKKISELLLKDQPFSLVRIGNMEGHFLECMHNNTKPEDQYFYWLTLTSGVYPDTMQYLSTTWNDVNKKAMSNADILGFVDISGSIRKNESFLSKNATTENLFFGENGILVLDPGYLTNLGCVSMTCENPWTENLKNKKVLVVTSFVDTVKVQWDKIHDVWGNLKDKIVPFDLVGAVRSPFHPLMDDRQYPNCETWDQTLKAICDEIDTYDYDVLFISSAAFAPALANHAKNKGKVGITICGVMQLFFGILGARWTGNNHLYHSWNRMFNRHWTYPLESDLPKNKHIFDRFEKAYWS